MGLPTSEIWRQIPPEEKFVLMSRAHSKGVAGGLITIVIAATFAVCLKNAWIMWGAILVSPVIFQLGAGKAWRDLRPRLILEYLAARSAARRYAFNANCKDLNVAFLFRGYFAEVPDKDQDPDDAMAMLEAALENNLESSVWIALFGDALVLMSERAGGAQCKFVHLLDDRLKVEAKALDDAGDYSNNKEILMTAWPERGNAPPKKYRVTSDHPAALVVFEKRLLAFHERARAEIQKEQQRLKEGGVKHIGA